MLINSCRRVLSLVDLNPLSGTYGCFDREFWHYKITKTMPSAAFQQAVLGLSVLYKNNFDGNMFCGNEEIKRAVTAGISYWESIQNPDGSFNEWYKNEHSFCVTAYTLFGISEALINCKTVLDKEWTDKIIKTITISAVWLAKHNNHDVANQMTAAMLALHNTCLLTGDKTYLNASNAKKEALLAMQSEEGWFNEYGGFDTGYSFVTLDLLAHYLLKNPEDKLIEKAAEKLVDMLFYTTEDNGKLFAEAGSRGTAHFLPYGINLLSKTSSNARQLCQRFVKGVKADAFPTPECVDDRYLVYFYFNSWVLNAATSKNEINTGNSGENNIFTKYYKDAGIVSIKNNRFHFIEGLKKGSALGLCSKQGRIFYDYGYYAEFKNNKTALSNAFNKNSIASVNIETDKTEIFIISEFVYKDFKTSPWSIKILFNIFAGTLLRMDLLAHSISSLLKYKTIKAFKKAGLILERKIIVENNKIVINDKIINQGSNKILRFGINSVIAGQYCPSGNLKTLQNLEVENITKEKELTGLLAKQHEIKVQKTITVNDNGEILSEIIINKS